MSTQARASHEQMRRLAGATILQLAPDNDVATRNALTIASLLQRSGARPIIAGRDGKLAGEWRMAGGEWLALDHDSANPFKLRRNAARLKNSSRANASISCMPIAPARPGARSRRPSDWRSGSSPTCPKRSRRGAACARSIRRRWRAATM